MKRTDLLLAAQLMNWRQVIANGGPPCFFFQESARSFCGRAQRWQGHGAPGFHDFVSLADLLRIFEGAK